MRAAPGDLIAPSRLRDVAIGRFVAHGFDESLRCVVSRAGVIAALMRHRFGSKGTSRADNVVSRQQCCCTLKQQSQKAARGQLFAGPPFSRENRIRFFPFMRSVREGGDAAHEFIESLAAESSELARDRLSRGDIIHSCDEETPVRFVVRQSSGSMVDGLAMRQNTAVDAFGTLMEQYVAKAKAKAKVQTHDPRSIGLVADRCDLDNSQPHLPGFKSPPAQPAGQPVAR